LRTLLLALLDEGSFTNAHKSAVLGVIRGAYLKLPDGVALRLEDHRFVPSKHRDLVDAFAAVS